MKNIIDICKAHGIEVPEDKAKDFEKAVLENYKTVAEVEKLTGKIEKLTGDLKTANDTLEKFKDVDPDQMAKEIEEYKKQVKESEDKFKAELEKRDYTDAIDKLLDGIKFTSEAAKKSVKRDLMDNPLQYRNGAVLGFDEVIKQAKEADPSAFVDEEKQEQEQSKAKFTTGMNNGGAGAKTKEEIMAIKDDAERHAAIKQNIGLFVSQKN